MVRFFLKALDTGESYIRRGGTWEYINLGLAFIKATKSGKITTDASGFYHVSFNTDFIDSDYTVALSTNEAVSNSSMAHFANLTKNGFDIQTRNSQNGNALGNIVVSWLATRNYNP